MIRRRLYNPAQLTAEELKASFIARHETLAEMLRLIGEQTRDRPCQHMLLVGPRGMGKTTLGLRFLLAVRETPALACDWQPVAFHEESYEIGDLADFWSAALHHLTRATGDARWANRADALAQDEPDSQRQAAYGLASLMDFCRASGKRLILFVENLDIVFGQLRDEREVHALRASLIEHPDILVIGSANAVFNAIRSHGEPFYEFFRLFMLDGIGQEECLQILEALAEGDGDADTPGALRRERGRLETIRRLTGGNPRLLALACRMLIESPVGSPFEDLEQLIDEQTPYFKARIEALPVQARKVFHCLAEGWRPMLARELSAAAKLSSSHASAQLRQLVEKGYAREVHLAQEKRTRYEVADRFYNIYYILRFSRAGRDRLARLVAFLHDLFGPREMRSMYPQALEALRARAFPAAEMSDWLGVLTRYVAEDEEFTGRDDWHRKAISLVAERIGANAPVLGEINEAFAEQDRSRAAAASTRRGLELVQAGNFAEAETAFRKATVGTPDDAAAWTALGYTLSEQGRFEEAIATFERAAQLTHIDDPIARRVVGFGALTGASIALLNRDHFEAAAATGKRSFEYIHPDDEPGHRHMAAEMIRSLGNDLKRTGQNEEAVAFWSRASEYAKPDDPQELRDAVAKALLTKGLALEELGRSEEALSAWRNVLEYIHRTDPTELRQLAVLALRTAGATLMELKRLDDSIAALRETSKYVRIDDAVEYRRKVAELLAVASRSLNFSERFSESESVCKEATEIDLTCADAWHIWAEAILWRDDPLRLGEAETYARRATTLSPEDPAALHTLSDVLASRGNWTEAVDTLERAVRADADYKHEERPGLTDSFIEMVAAGHGVQVKRILEDAGLAKELEPLWFAIRIKLGEEIEPLPAEIMDAVNDIRQEFEARRP